MTNTTKPIASLLVATYEMPRHLELVCAGLEKQTSNDFEILFCDDGSGPSTAQIIKDFSQRVPFKVQHVWQEHNGFRKCKILNQAVRQAGGSILIFLDGDCIPHKYFVCDHIEQQEEGFYLAGRRMELGPKISQWLTPQHVRRGFFDHLSSRLILSSIVGDSEHMQRSVRIPWKKLRTHLGMDKIDDLKGCNYSVSRKDLEAINGFDEEYEGYGREDTDVEMRLQNLGLKIKSIKGLALQFHVWHPRREFTPANDKRLFEIHGRVRCQMGLTHD